MDDIVWITTYISHGSEHHTSKSGPLARRAVYAPLGMLLSSWAGLAGTSPWTSQSIAQTLIDMTHLQMQQRSVYVLCLAKSGLALMCHMPSMPSRTFLSSVSGQSHRLEYQEEILCVDSSSGSPQRPYFLSFMLGV